MKLPWWRINNDTAQNPQTIELGALVTELRSLIHTARHSAATTINTLQVLTNFEIGRRIVEHEQQGEKRAGYGKEPLKTLSVQLTEEFGKSFSERNHRSFRAFFLTDQSHTIEIWQKPSVKSSQVQIGQMPPDQFTISHTTSGKSGSVAFKTSASVSPLILFAFRV